MKNNYKWVYPQHNDIKEELFDEIKKAAGSEIIAKLLINRGITTPEEARAFLDFNSTEISSPFVFPDMEKTVERIDKAIKNNEHIVVFGDFDADGVTSTALLYKTLKLLEANVSYYLPDRQDEGHGLNRACVCKLISSRKAKLIITVDCGISNFNEVKLAASLGTDIIITDHHEPQEEIPAAFTIINPKMLEETPETKSLKYLAGVGVAYKLALALLKFYGKEHLHDEVFYFVPLGTVGDVVPLLGENRVFVHQGINLISQKRPPSIGKILEISGYKTKQKISAGTIAFGIVPKINAVGRLSDASPIIDFLLNENEEELDSYARELSENNKRRQDLCESIFSEAEKKIKQEIDLEKNKAIILAQKDWHPGIIGIVASRLVETHYRPVFLISIDEEKNEARGSARSIESLNLFNTLSEHAEMFIQFGGHALAAGFCFDLAKMSIQGFKEKITSSIDRNLDIDKLKPELKIDVDLEPEDLTESLVKEIERLEPFGEANPAPVFSISNLTLLEIKKMGSKKNHLKLFLTNEEGLKFEAVWWNKENIHVEAMEKVNIAFVPSLNDFNGKTTVQLVIKDLKPASDKEPEFDEGEEETFFESEFKEITEILDESETLSQPETSAAQDNSGVKWVDHRNSTGFKKDFITYMKSLCGNIAIFAESERSLNALGQDTVLKEFSINRTNLQETDCLVIMDLPGDEKTFLDMLGKTRAKEVHLIGLMPEINPVETVKKFSGMLKYAFKNKNGQINIESIASFLSISSESVLACTELLDGAGVINVLEISEDSVKFDFTESIGLNTVLQHAGYQNFIDTLEESERFRQKLSVLEINRIQEMSCQKCFEVA